MTLYPFLDQIDKGVCLKLRVVPRASRDRLDGVHGGALKIRLTAPPVDGEANRAVAAFLSKLLKIPKSSITIESGHRSRDKRALITGAVIADIERALAEALR